MVECDGENCLTGLFHQDCVSEHEGFDDDDGSFQCEACRSDHGDGVNVDEE